MADIKSMLDDIIGRTNASYTDPASNVIDGNLGAVHSVGNPVTFDKGAFREKLSMYVLKDIICAMMQDDTSDIDNVIDNAIIRHINQDCGCTCYDYLSNARNRLKSDLIGDIIQEINEAADNAATKVSQTKDPETAAIDVAEILNNVENYEDFKKLLAAQVGKQVVDDMAKTISKSNEAPTFTPAVVDQKINDNTKDVSPVVGVNDTAVEESYIMQICSNIIHESYVDGEPTIGYEEGLERAFVEYCIEQLDMVTKTTPKIGLMARFK